MRKLVYLFAFCGIIFSSNAQEVKTEPSSKLKPFFGVKGGFNIVTTKEDGNGRNFSLGYQFGGTLTVPISSKFSFQPELFLQTIVVKYNYYNEYSNGFYSEEITYRNNYLQLPLLFKYSISKKVAIELGPNLNYVTSAKRKVKEESTLDGVSSSSVYTYKLKPTSNRLGYGINLGTTYDIDSQMYVGFRYNLFIRQFQTLDSTLDNSAFVFSLGYNFK
jgi:opacity protein-like surface antigen